MHRREIAIHCYRMLGSIHEPAPGLRQLSTDHRAVIVHHYYLGLSLSEIANALDIPVGTAKSRLHHARLALRDAIGPDAQPSEGHIA